MNWEQKKQNIEDKFGVVVHLEWGGWEIGWRASVDEDIYEGPDNIWNLYTVKTGYRKNTALKELEVHLEWVFGPDGSQDGCPSGNASENTND